MTSTKIDRATPRIAQSMKTAEQVVDTSNEVIPNIIASTNYGKAPDVQTSTTSWKQSVDDLDANNQLCAKLRNDLELALQAKPALVRRCNARKRAVLAAVDNFCDGSKDMVVSFGLSVEDPQPAPDATVPQNVRPMVTTRPHAASVRSDIMPGATGYMIQSAINPADASTYAAPIAVGSARFRLTGQTAGVTVYFRVLAIDPSLPTGQTAYSAWVAVLVPV